MTEGKRDYTAAQAVLEQLVAGKRRRRKQLAALPVSEKVLLLIEMQRRANDVRRMQGRPERRVWRT